METLALHETPRRPAKLVAPLWHTVLFVSIILALTIGGALFQRAGSVTASPAPRHSAVPLYLSLLALEYGLVVAIARGIRKSGTTIRELVGGRWDTISDVVRDVVVAALLWVTWLAVATVWQRIHPGAPVRSISPLLPQGPVEVVLWIALSMTAGFAEELAFRGYFQRQCGALTGSIGLAIAMQAGLFGIAHGYQGVDACLHIAVYGAMFGCVAAWRGSLRSGMIAHAWTDIAAGLLRI